MEGRVRMTPLTWVSGGFRAQVLAARLRSEGIDAQLQGAISSPYGLTVGGMARVDVYVPEDQLDDAKYVLLADEVDASMAAPTEWWDAGTDRSRGRSPWVLWVAALLLAACVGAALVGALHHW
jgi:hypothetical protein